MPDSLFQQYKTASLAHIDLVARHAELRRLGNLHEAHEATLAASATKVSAALAALNEARAAYLAAPT
jgi:hypothetical protein